MFEDYKGVIHLEQVIKEKYHYQYEGLITLSSQSFIELEGNGKDALCWIIYDNEKYLFKPLEEADYNVWGELLSEEIAKFLNIPCAEYRVATLGDQKGIISKNFLKKEDTLVIGSEIYQNFFNEIHYHKNGYNIPSYLLELEQSPKKNYAFRYLNNLEQTWIILNNSSIIDKKDVPNIVNALTKMLLFDLITLQCDRHPNNWGIIKTNSACHLSPLYDNSLSFGLGYPFMDRRIENFRSEIMNSKILKDKDRVYSFVYQSSPSFTLIEEQNINIKKKSSIPKILLDFFNKSDEKTKQWIIDTLSSFKENTIEKMIEKIENKFQIKMKQELYYYIVEIFNLNIETLKGIANSYGKESSKNEVPKNIRTI